MIRFDAPVAPGLTMVDPRMRSDGRTKRVLCLQALTEGFGNGRLGASAVAALAAKFDWVVRWRVDNGRTAFSTLQPADFDAFVRRLRVGSVIELIDVPERLDAIAPGVLASVLRPRAGRGSSLCDVDWALLAQLIGGTSNSIVSSATFRAALLSRMPQLRVDLPAQDVNASAASSASPGETAASMLDGYLAVWRCLRHATLAGLLSHDPLGFDPFPGRSAGWLARRHGSANDRTPTLRPQQSFRLAQAATRWLLERGPAVVQAVAGSEATAVPGPGPDRQQGSLFLARGTAGEGGPLLPLETEVRHMMAACAILIGLLAGRRRGEVRSIRAGCASTPQPGVHELSTYIEKTVRGVDRVPVPALIVEAVRLLEALSQTARLTTGEGWLFRAKLPGTGRLIELDLSVDFQNFAAARGLGSGPGALTHPLASHQLRRGFAIFMYHGSRIGSLESVGRQLRHADAEFDKDLRQRERRRRAAGVG